MKKPASVSEITPSSSGVIRRIASLWSHLFALVDLVRLLRPRGTVLARDGFERKGPRRFCARLLESTRPNIRSARVCGQKERVY